MTIDLTKYEEATEIKYELVPEGKYTITVEKCVQGTTGTGKPKYDIQFSVEGTNQKLFNSPLLEHIEGTLEMFGVKSAEHLIGRTAENVTVKHKEYNGNMYANVIVPMKLIPTTEALNVRLDIQRSDDGYITTGKTGAKYVNIDLTVLSPSEYEGRHIFGKIGVFSPKGDKYRNIGFSQSLSIINSANGIEESDSSEKAIELRQLKDDYSNLDGLKFWMTANIEKSEGYSDKNSIGKIITPSSKEWEAIKIVKSMTGNAPVVDIDDELPSFMK